MGKAKQLNTKTVKEEPIKQVVPVKELKIQEPPVVAKCRTIGILMKLKNADLSEVERLYKKNYIRRYQNKKRPENNPDDTTSYDVIHDYQKMTKRFEKLQYELKYLLENKESVEKEIETLRNKMTKIDLKTFVSKEPEHEEDDSDSEEDSEEEKLPTPPPPKKKIRK